MRDNNPKMNELRTGAPSPIEKRDLQNPKKSTTFAFENNKTILSS